MTGLDAALAAVVGAAVAPLVGEIRELRAAVDALRAASPSRLVTVAELVRLGYGSPATVRRRIADGTYPRGPGQRAARRPGDGADSG